MKISDFQYSTWNQMSDDSVVYILSNQHNDVEKRLADAEEEKMLITAERLVKSETKKHGFPHVIFTFPDSKRAMRCMFVAPLDRNPEDMEFSNPNSLPPYEELVLDED